MKAIALTLLLTLLVGFSGCQKADDTEVAPDEADVTATVEVKKVLNAGVAAVVEVQPAQ
jgi:hypothetical protein